MIIVEELEISKSERFTKAFIKVLNFKKEYDSVINFHKGKIIKWNCTCKWGSIGRFQKKYIMLDKKCKHIESGIRLLVFLHYLDSSYLK